MMNLSRGLGDVTRPGLAFVPGCRVVAFLVLLNLLSESVVFLLASLCFALLLFEDGGRLGGLMALVNGGAGDYSQRREDAINNFILRSFSMALR